MTVSPMATGQTRTGGQAEELLSWVTPRRHRASAMRPQDIHLAPQPPKARKPGAQQHQSARQAAVEAAEAAAEVAAEDPLSPRRPPKKVAAVPVFSSKQISQSKNPLRNALGGSGGAAGWGAVTKNIVDPNRFEKVKKEVVRQQAKIGPVGEMLAIKDSINNVFASISAMHDRLLTHQLIRRPSDPRLRTKMGRQVVQEEEERMEREAEEEERRLEAEKIASEKSGEQKENEINEALMRLRAVFMKK